MDVVEVYISSDTGEIQEITPKRIEFNEVHDFLISLDFKAANTRRFLIDVIQRNYNQDLNDKKEDEVIDVYGKLCKTGASKNLCKLNKVKSHVIDIYDQLFTHHSFIEKYTDNHVLDFTIKNGKLYIGVKFSPLPVKNTYSEKKYLKQVCKVIEPPAGEEYAGVWVRRSSDYFYTFILTAGKLVTE